ncbi:MAG TPA: COX15/CtaA family protein, partial [Anaerolineae bacterium]|nr:COX15/CtaA family protein [Anaerolineae bacterium]
KAIGWRRGNWQTIGVIIALVGVMLVGVTGTVTALGDTLFPSSSLAQGLQQDLNPTAHFLIQLRVIHPIVAVLTAGYIWLFASLFHGAEGAITGRLATALRLLVLVQLFAGGINILLLAPTWMQLLHLFIADMVWITLVLYGASLLALETEASPASFTSRGAVSSPA